MVRMAEFLAPSPMAKLVEFKQRTVAASILYYETFTERPCSSIESFEPALPHTLPTAL
jgi:hypothetical protein